MVNWYSITSNALTNFWTSFINFIPNLLIGILTFLIGWIIATIIGKIISQILLRLQFNRLFEKASWREALEKAEIKVNPAEFVGAIFKWVLVIMVLLISAQILLGLEVNPFQTLLENFIVWIPNFIIAIVIFIVAVIVADLLDKVIIASTKRIGVEYVGLLGIIVRWIIYIFAGIAILMQLQIEVASWIADILKILFAGIVIAFAIAFGFGGKDAAAKFVEDMRRKISEK